MSTNFAVNDVLDNGMEINDDNDDSMRWDPMTLRRVWPKIKIYCKDNFSPWKTLMSLQAIVTIIILLYLASFAGQLQTKMKNFGKRDVVK